MTIAEPTATELRTARIVSNIRKDQIVRETLDSARELIEEQTTTIAALTGERAMSVGIVTQLDIENQRLNADNDELRRMCEIVERIIGERDRARDLAVRAGAFEPNVWPSDLTAELADMVAQRDQLLWERDSARAAL